MFKTEIMSRARDRAASLGVRNVVVATNTGASVRAAREAFGEGYRLFAVGNPASSHERGLCLHDGISEDTRENLEQAGIQVILHDQTLFQGEPACADARQQHDAAALAYARRYHKRDQLRPGSQDLVPIMQNVLTELLGDGPRVCLEIALVAADSGKLPLDADCMAIATPSSYGDLPDAAVTMRPATSRSLFSMQLRIKDLLLCPTDNDAWLASRPLG
jgi:uncharacterized protein